MVVLRILFLAFFLLLALGLVAWQGWAMMDLAAPLSLDSMSAGWILIGITLAVALGEAFVLARCKVGLVTRWLTIIVIYGGLCATLALEAQARLFAEGGWGFLFPLDLVLLVLLVAAAMPLIIGRGKTLRAISEKTGVAIIMVALNLLLPIQLAAWLYPPEFKMRAGLTAVALLFFLFVDYYLVRALLHYFTSGATTFISMRYLRKRPVSLASIMGVAAGICVLIVVNSIMNGFTNEYRTQVRGTMSDVMVYVEPDLYYPSEYEVDQELWAYTFDAIKDHPVMDAQWQDAVAHAQAEMLAEGSGGYSKAEAEAGAFPATRKVDPDQITLDLQTLDSRSGFRFAKRLPVHPSLGRATPANIYFAHLFANNPAGQPQGIAALRAKLATKLFVPKMRAGMDVLRKVADTNPKTEAHAARLQNVTALTSDGMAEVFQQASIVGVDPLKDPQVTNIGDFVRDAFYDTTKHDKVLMPLLRLMNGILLFEDADADLLERRLTPIGYDASGALMSAHGPWRDYVSERNVLSATGSIRWEALDAVRFRADTPGKELYKVWRAALKLVSSTQDAASLKRIVIGLEDDLLSIIDEHLGKADNRALFTAIPRSWRDTGIAFGERMGRQLDPVDDPRLVLAYFRYWYVQGIWREHAKLITRVLRLNEDIGHELAATSFTDPDGKSVELVPNAEIKALRAGIDQKIHDFLEGVLPTLVNRDAFAEQSAAFYADLKSYVDTWVAIEANANALVDFNPSALSMLQSITPSEARFLNLPDGRAALGELIATWDQRWDEALRRGEAYRQILPLRAYLLPYERVGEYLIRARGRLPYRADGELWEDTPADIALTRETAISIIREGFIAHRITRSATDALPLDASVAAREGPFFDAILEVAQASQERLAKIPAASGVAALEAELENFRERVAHLYRDRREALVKADGREFEAELRELFSVVERDREYWKLRPVIPGVILGASLAEAINADIGATVQAHILRIARRTSFDDGPGHSFRAGEETFRVNAHFKSGLYAANIESLFGDFETWLGLYGASRATYLLAVKLKGFDASMSVPHSLVAEYERALSKMREAVPLVSIDGKTPLRLTSEEQAILSGWCENPADNLSRRNDHTRFTTWERQNAGLLSAVEREKNMLTLLLGLIEVLAGVVILIVVYLTVVEKVKDIGILKAMGASPWGVRSIFMFNALYIGVFGTVIGAGLAIIISENLHQIEDWIAANFGVRLFPPDIYYLTYIPSVKGEALVELALKMAVPTMLWAFFCGIGPAMVASKKDTVEALQYE